MESHLTRPGSARSGLSKTQAKRLGPSFRRANSRLYVSPESVQVSRTGLKLVWVGLSFEYPVAPVEQQISWYPDHVK